MINEKDKANRLVKEFLSYFFTHNLLDITMNLLINEQATTIDFTVKCSAEPADFAEFVQALKVPRQYELEEYFNSLLGAHHGSRHDYTFLGQAIDEAEGKYADSKLFLHIVRYQEKEK